MKINCAHDDLVALDELRPNPKNANKHPKKQIELLAKIMRHQGWRNPIVVSNRSGLMTKGHGRLEAAKLNAEDDQAWLKAPVDYQDYESEADELADMVADNKIAELAESDELKIQEIALDLGPDFDFDLFGIPDFRIVGVDTLPPVGDQDAIPEPPKEPKTRRGDIYELGRHRLMCGDSTIMLDFARLMADQKADMIWTDPPYNVAYEGGTGMTIKNDDMDDESFYKFLYDVYTNMLMVARPGASIYVAHADLEGANFRRAMKASGWLLKQCLIWVKNSLVMGRADYQWRHEPILYGWAPGASHNWYSDRCQTTVLEFKRPTKNADHPTMKPVDLIEYCIGNSSRPGDIVLDPFGGGGSTLVAAEKTKRRAFLMELDPKYCDVIVRRYEEYTGQKARLLTGSDQPQISGTMGS